MDARPGPDAGQGPLLPPLLLAFADSQNLQEREALAVSVVVTQVPGTCSICSGKENASGAMVVVVVLCVYTYNEVRLLLAIHVLSAGAKYLSWLAGRRRPHLPGLPCSTAVVSCLTPEKQFWGFPLDPSCLIGLSQETSLEILPVREYVCSTLSSGKGKRTTGCVRDRCEVGPR